MFPTCGQGRVEFRAVIPFPSIAMADVAGKPRIIDGDTIELSGQKIRLHGIDAPEAKQTCTREGKEWRCGQEATWALARIIEEHWVTCKPKDRDRYGRIVAVCHMAEGQIDINGLMVEQGWALAYRKYSEDYVERRLRRRLRGLGYGPGSLLGRGSGGGSKEDASGQMT